LECGSLPAARRPGFRFRAQINSIGGVRLPSLQPSMFLRLVADSFTRRPRRKILSMAALALGMAVATAALSVSLDIGDRLAREFRSLGANLLVTPQADSLPLEIGGVDYRPANAGAYLPQDDLGKLKTIFWRHNIMAFSPVLDVPVLMDVNRSDPGGPSHKVELLGTWVNHELKLPDGDTYATGIERTNPWWQLKEGRWFNESGSTTGSEVLVGEKLAQRLGVTLGSKLYLFEKPISAVIRPVTVVGVLTTGGSEDEEIIAPLSLAQAFANQPGMYRRLYVSALTKPEDVFSRRDPKTMTSAEYDRWYCSPYISSIALQINEVLKGTDVRVIRRVAEGEGNVLSRVRTLLWLVTLAALLASALAVGASAAASVIERRSEIGLMKALGANSGLVGVLLASEQLLLAIVGGGIGYAVGIVLARAVGERIFGFTPEPKLFVLFVILALAALITLLGSAWPLRRASRYDPAPILRGE
jgi:putative ABC transport system permease protein